MPALLTVHCRVSKDEVASESDDFARPSGLDGDSYKKPIENKNKLK